MIDPQRTSGRALLRHVLHRVAYGIDRAADALWPHVRRHVGDADPLYITAYRGYGTPREAFLRGRVLAGVPLEAAAAADTWWDNLRAMIQRFGSRERAGVHVRARLGTTEHVAETDSDGYFRFHLTDEALRRTEQPWHEVALRLDVAGPRAAGARAATGHVLVPPASSRFGVISDIDDTVIKTGATDLFAMLRLTLFGNAHTRLPFKGVAAFYRALHRGAGGGERNPVFYVSSSPWNLYDFLIHFMDVHGIPAGPLFLRDLGIDRDTFIMKNHHVHKLTQIERLLSLYADRPFILIGDSGQQDPEIYRHVLEDFPGRVRTIYIRDVAAGARQAEVQALAEEVRAQDAELLLVPDTVAAAEHAARRGFIEASELEAIRIDRAKDQ